MKSTAVDENLYSMNQQFCSRENQLLQIDAVHFLEMMEVFGLDQNVKLSTHKQGNTLNLILSE